MTDNEKSSSNGGIQVIERAARILRVVKESRTGMSLGQIARAVELPRSTVQRIVGALMTEGFVASGAKAGRIRLGPTIAALAGQSRADVVEACRLVLSELSQGTGETADLSVMRGAAMIFIDQIPGMHRLRTVSSVGDAFPLTTTANGLACLASLEPAEARRLAMEEWQRNGVARDVAAFEDRLSRIRSTGLAYDLDEHTDGISAIGVAFRDWSGELYAMSVPIPSSRFPSVKEVVERLLLSAKAQAVGLMAID